VLQLIQALEIQVADHLTRFKVTATAWPDRA